jgi:hypothetical protein
MQSLSERSLAHLLLSRYESYPTHATVATPKEIACYVEIMPLTPSNMYMTSYTFNAFSLLASRFLLVKRKALVQGILQR